MNSPSCSIFFHNFYGQHEKWVKFFSEKLNTPFTLYYNIVEDSIYNLEDDYRQSENLQKAISGPWLKKLILRRSPNKGKDIGGKLVLLDAYMHEEENSDYIIFLHDKKSPYKIQNQQWADKLFKIIEPDFAKQAIALFKDKKEVGIIAGTESIINEYDYARQDFISNNGSQLSKLRSEYNISSTDYRYAAGTMFWTRSIPLLDFFRFFPPLEVRKTLENGNIMDETGGSITHSWERMLSWLIFAQGYTIKGL